jgi:hypothetical protein
MGLVCLVCGNETELEFLFSLPDDAPLSCPHCDGLDVPGSYEAPGLVPVVQATLTAASNHEAA